MNRKNVCDVLIITLKLLVICTGIALLVAFVNDITYEKIKENQRIKVETALKEIYGQDSTYKEFTIKSPEKAFNAMYVMYDKNDELLGYCASVSPMGFKAEIDMLVAADTNKQIIDVKITGMSETSGIGTKVAQQDFLSKFKGISNSCPASSAEGGVDIIAGATKSSKPVINGVDIALKEMQHYSGQLQKVGHVNE